MSAHDKSPPPSLKKPAGQNAQEAGGEENVPSGHDDAEEHDEAPAKLYLKAAQSTHVVRLVAADAALYFPAGQATQEAGALAKVPAGQVEAVNRHADARARL